ncbi:MAG: DNA polymerase III subunit [Candidatus Pacebacteria bacterium]|nr:DNA polymerase III subunit [Candidatus Paceibacterota bacterium]
MNSIGHKTEKGLLAKLIRNDTVPHAFLFSGPKKIGKKRVALEFIKSISCTNSGNDWGFCDNCYSCRNLESNTFPDFIFIKPEEDSKDIKIEQIRDMQERFTLTSFGGNYKMVVVDDAHLMNQHTQNSFLKFLEEPRGKTIIILVSDRPDMLLPTIRSRVQNIKFSILPKKEIENHLLSLGEEAEKAKEIAAISSGQIGKAVEYHENPERKEWFDSAIKDLNMLMRANLGKKFAYSKENSENYESLVEMFEVWERYFRKELLIKIMKPSESRLEKYSILKVKGILKKISQSKNLIESTNSNKKLVLDGLMMEL